MKPKYLYHGMPNELHGAYLLPHKARDLGRNPHNMRKSVYATDIKEAAIAMSIISSKGVHASSINLEETNNWQAIIYEGWPEQEHVFLCTLNPRTFIQFPPNSHQWASSIKVKPSRIEKLSISKYITLVRKATRQEQKTWSEKYHKKLPKNL